MFGQRFPTWLVLGAATLMLVMLVCPYLPTPTGMLHGPSAKLLLFQAMCLVLVAALPLVAPVLEPAGVFTETLRSLPTTDLTDLTCTRLC